ncbi:uncharacterized protein [Palaemon carinicauda]|uniref:uncharacterized protein n=1 Tax=Palaemon carinicauda TaxID=392227 RepID=UPI0035B6394D
MGCENRENEINATAFPVGDGLGPRLIPPKNWQGLPSQGRAGLKRQAQRKISEERMKVSTLNVGTLIGKGRELVDLMEGSKIGVLCLQETRWKGNKLSRTEDHVYGPAGRSKAALGLWQDVFCENKEAVKENPSVNLTRDV